METFRWRGKHSSNSDVAKRLRAILLSHEALNTLVQILPASSPLYAVGGAVRDLLLNQVLTDIDLATPLPPEEVLALLSKGGIRVVETGISHGTVLAVVAGQHVEITTFRAPSERTSTSYSSTIEEDLSGRDFTINAMAVSLRHDQFLDPWGGYQALMEQRLSAVGDPESRFTEDPLRLLRYIRFGAAQGRTADEPTKEAARKTSSLLTEIHWERIQKEFSLILTSPFAAAGIREMVTSGLLRTVLPELMPAIGCEQNRFHIHDVFEHTLWVLERCPQDDLILRLTALFHDAGKPATLSIGENGERHFYLHEKVSEDITREALARLRYPKKLIETTAKLVRHHMRPLDCGPSGARRIMRDLGEDFGRWRTFKAADSPPIMSTEEFAALETHFDALIAAEEQRLNSIHTLAINGHDVIALGVKEGPDIGRVLGHLREATLENPDLNLPDLLREEAKRFAAKQGLLG